MTAIPTMTSRTRPTVINLRRSHRRPAFEMTACFASVESGSAGNDLGGGDCPSSLFKALRMELKMTILQNCIFLPIGMYVFIILCAELTLHKPDRLLAQIRHLERFSFSIENNFGQRSNKPIYRNAVFGLHLFDGTPCPGIVYVAHFDIAKAQLM